MILPDPSGAEIARRLEVRRRTGDIDALWPDVPAGARRVALGRIVEVTRALLKDSGARPTLTADERADARALGVAGFLSGMGPLLGHWIAEGRVPADLEVTAVMARHLEHGERRISRMSSEAARIVRAMRAVGVDPIVLKGLHTGAAYFPVPATRPAADIDLLVPAASVADAERALQEAGFVSSRRTAYASRSEWRLADARSEVRSLEYDHGDNPWSVDLHSALERWYFRGMRRDLGDGAFATTERVEIGTERTRVLAQPWLLAFLALHAAHDLASVRLVRLLEIVLVARADLAEGRLDWAAFSELLERNDAARCAYPAMSLVEELAPGTVPASWLAAEERRATGRMRRALETVRAARLSPLVRVERGLAVKLAWARGPRELAANLTDVLVPSDDGLPVGLARLWAQRVGALRDRLTSGSGKSAWSGRAEGGS